MIRAIAFAWLCSAAALAAEEITVVIDPGHGGVDPGAIQGGVREAALMLTFAQELSAALIAQDVHVVLTRADDSFVSLQARTTRARAAGADLFLSLHADALNVDNARGASVYTLAEDAADTAGARMAARHERDDLIRGVDLTGQSDDVATVLMDLARAQTAPKAARFAATLIAALDEKETRLHPNPLKAAPLAVLAPPDFASVLIEVGFLSSAQDRALLTTAAGRAPIIAGIVAAVQTWAADEAARAPLLRQ